jgi:enoyl-[acyl-carrier protein] reductase II
MRVLRNDTTDRYDADPSLLKKFPDQLAVAFNDGTFHLGGDENTDGVDPRREGYPAGQAVGAITSIVPAGDIVRSIVAEAQCVIDALAAL